MVSSIALATGAASVYSFSRLRSNFEPDPKNAQTNRAILFITSLGRIEPEGEVIRLSTNNNTSGGVARIESLLVKQGDRIHRGQVIALLNDRSLKIAQLEQAKKQVPIYQAKLAQVKAGAKSGDILAQQATIANLKSELAGQRASQNAVIARLQADLRDQTLGQTATLAGLQAEFINARLEYQRYKSLKRDGAISASVMDTKRLTSDTAEQHLNEAKANLSRTKQTIIEQINEAKATLKRSTDTLEDQQREARAKLASIAEVRPVDVQLAQSELDSAISAVKQAQAEKELTDVRSPIDGEVLKIHTKTGEVIGSEGIAEIGKTDQMYVAAEVYQTDIEKVHLGKKATITSTGFTGKIQGTVTEIGKEVNRQNVFSVSPGVDTDRKVVEVKIRINDPADSKRVVGLTNLQVEVAISL